MNEKLITDLAPFLLQGLQLLLTHHQTNSVSATPESQSAAGSVLGKIAQTIALHQPDIETGKGLLPTS